MKPIPPNLTPFVVFAAGYCIVAISFFIYAVVNLINELKDRPNE